VFAAVDTDFSSLGIAQRTQLMEEPRDLRWSDFFNFARQMLDGLKVLHSVPVFARVITSRKYLISKSWRLKILACPWAVTCANAPTCACRMEDVYRAPETFDEKPRFSQSSDIWGVGVVLWGKHTSTNL
jgi:Protein tyrosine and serine/threonine kinase